MSLSTALAAIFPPGRARWRHSLQPRYERRVRGKNAQVLELTNGFDLARRLVVIYPDAVAAFTKAQKGSPVDVDGKAIGCTSHVTDDGMLVLVETKSISPRSFLTVVES